MTFSLTKQKSPRNCRIPVIFAVPVIRTLGTCIHLLACWIWLSVNITAPHSSPEEREQSEFTKYPFRLDAVNWFIGTLVAELRHLETGTIEVLRNRGYVLLPCFWRMWMIAMFYSCFSARWGEQCGVLYIRMEWLFHWYHGDIIVCGGSRGGVIEMGSIIRGYWIR